MQSKPKKSLGDFSDYPSLAEAMSPKATVTVQKIVTEITEVSVNPGRTGETLGTLVDDIVGRMLESGEIGHSLHIDLANIWADLQVK
jgi:hypothetical protein